MKKFSYKDFCDSIAVGLRTYRAVSPTTVNIVWKEAVKYILRELQNKREVYVPYIGYMSIKDDDVVVTSLNGGNRKSKVKGVKWVEFKPFKIFLDGINTMDTNDDRKMTIYLQRNRLDEINFVKQDYDEYVEKYVEPYYTKDDVASTKAIIKGQDIENEILDDIANNTYRKPYSHRDSISKAYVRYEKDGEVVIEKLSKAMNKFKMSRYCTYDFYWKNCAKCWDDDVKMNLTDEVDMWLIGNEKQAKQKGYL